MVSSFLFPSLNPNHKQQYHHQNSHNMVPGESSSAEGEESPSTSTRRGLFTKAFGGILLSGLVYNGIAVQGPPPYIPPPHSLDGKVVVITGGNTGLGLETAKRLAAGGATIVLTSRSLEKGLRAVQDVKLYVQEQQQQQMTGGGDNDTTGANVFSLPLDLCDMESVKTFPTLYSNLFTNKSNNNNDNNNNNNTPPPIDVLINNAGVMAIPERQITKDGFEKTFQSNHLGHFALTALLYPYLNKTNNNGCRVINVASAAHMLVKELDDTSISGLNSEDNYGKWNAYGKSKMENILFSKELQRRADASNVKIQVASLHPGAVRTDLPRYIVGEDKFISMNDVPSSSSSTPIPFSLAQLAALPGYYFTKNVQRGANTQIWLGAGMGGEDIRGKYYQNMQEVIPNAGARDMNKAKELWERSEEMSGVLFPI